MLNQAPQYKDTMPSVLRRLISQLSLSIEEIKQFDNSPTHECHATLFKGLLCQPFFELVCELVDTHNGLNGDLKIDNLGAKPMERYSNMFGAGR
jgi:hypothetical protein